jgi:hypothetical protein
MAQVKKVSLLPNYKDFKVFHFIDHNIICAGYIIDHYGIDMTEYKFSNNFTVMSDEGKCGYLPMINMSKETYQPSDNSIYILSSKFNLIYIYYQTGNIIRLSLKYAVQKIAVSYNGNCLFGITCDNIIIDCYKNKIIMNAGINNKVCAFAVSNDGNFVAISFEGYQYLCLYDIKLKRMFHMIYCPLGASYISFDKESTLMGVLCFNNIINIYNIKAIYSRSINPIRMFAIGNSLIDSFIHTKFRSHPLHDKNLDKLIAGYIF